jgi:GNAT superfamily N-acetyltransferase
VKGDSGSVPYVLRPHRAEDMAVVVRQEGAGYTEQYGWDQTFEALVARIVDAFVKNFDPLRERCWIAEIEGKSVGHIFLVRHPSGADTAKLRLLYVDPSARGRGLGDALVKECVRFAREFGYKRIELWTQSILIGAHRIYERAGFRLVKEERHRSFGKDLVGQTWELEFAGEKKMRRRPLCVVSALWSECSIDWLDGCAGVGFLGYDSGGVDAVGDGGEKLVSVFFFVEYGLEDVGCFVVAE